MAEDVRLNERSILDYFFEEEIEQTGKSSEKISTIRENEVRLAQDRFQISTSFYLVLYD